MPKMTVELSPKLDRVVSQLAADQHVAKAQVIRRAVALLEYFEDAQAKGSRIIVRDEDGDREIVSL